jgi:hypothetical protein
MRQGVIAGLFIEKEQKIALWGDLQTELFIK